MDMISLGRSKENAVDAAIEGAQQQVGLALAEAGENLCEGHFEVVDGGRAGIEGA